MAQLRITLHVGLHDREGRPLGEAGKKTAIKCASALFAGFTCYDAQGYWRGASEPTLVLEIIGDAGDLAMAKGLARLLARQLNQECVAVSTSTLASVDFLTGKEEVQS